jgi:two-component system phosphate regulon response regulator PhoB
MENPSPAQTILVVDDDADCRSVVNTVLASSGYKVIEASDGYEALKTLKTMSPDLIVLDIMMPGLSGYDVVIHMKQRPETQNIPIVMLTAKGEYDDVISGYNEYSVDYYISKPFTSKQLISGIKLVLE